MISIWWLLLLLPALLVGFFSGFVVSNHILFKEYQKATSSMMFNGLPLE
jgi:hypothetical protein